MNISIISNCQGESIGKCIQLMNSDIQAKFYMSTDVQYGKYDFATICEESNYIFIQKHALGNDFVVPTEYANKFIYFPNVAFTGFHPDMTYVRGENIETGVVETVFTPMYSYNSSIVLYAFLQGKTIDETVALFNPTIFSKLGFFEEWSIARKNLIEEANSTGLDIDFIFDRWARTGIFMHSFNHPTIHVLADLAELLLRKINIQINSQNIARYLTDPLAAMPVWPVYPELAERLGHKGDYTFKQNENNDVISLRNFIIVSFDSYSKFKKDTLEGLNFSMEDYVKRLSGENDQLTEKIGGGNPYKACKDYQFWRRGVAQVNSLEVDPVVFAKFNINRTDKVATAGSCFAQHIAKTLVKNGFNYFITEQAPSEMTPEESYENNYGVFSARYGNVYTVKQLLQLILRAYGEYKPNDNYWIRSDGKYIDPFRPQINSSGFDSLDDLLLSREEHFRAVRRIFEEMNVFVFTLGLTEGWRSKIDGAVFPLAPGVVAEKFDNDEYEFVNFNIDDIRADLLRCIQLIHHANPLAKILLTISPVPLIATYEPQHVLTSTFYSKSVLRVAADEISKLFDFVAYFPSYEIIMGPFNKGSYYESDLRTVTPEGVGHVMRLFSQHYMNEQTDALAASVQNENESSQANEKVTSVKRNIFDIVCDEEAIANFK